jgi:hypothetical protein
MLTLILVAALQQTPLDLTPPPPPPQVTRESIRRAAPASRGLRVVGMSAMWFAAVLGTGAVGILPGALLGGAGGGFQALGGGLIGAAVGMGVGALLAAPVLMWALGHALGGKGSLLATYAGALLGAAIAGGLALAWFNALGTAYLTGYETANVLGPIFAACSPMLIAGGPWAFEISHSVNAPKVSPIVAPINGGAIAGLGGRF